MLFCNTMKPLSNQERRVLYMISRGGNYRDCADHEGKNVETIHVIAHHIRQKTGIKDTRDHAECREFIRGHRPQLHPDKVPKPPSPKQIEILRLVVQGQTYKAIATHFGIRPQTVQNHASCACIRIGVNAKGAARLSGIATWLEHYDAKQADAMNDPAF